MAPLAGLAILVQFLATPKRPTLAAPAAVPRLGPLATRPAPLPSPARRTTRPHEAAAGARATARLSGRTPPGLPAASIVLLRIEPTPLRIEEVPVREERFTSPALPPGLYELRLLDARRRPLATLRLRLRPGRTALGPEAFRGS